MLNLVVKNTPRSHFSYIILFYGHQHFKFDNNNWSFILNIHKNDLISSNHINVNQ